MSYQGGSAGQHRNDDFESGLYGTQSVHREKAATDRPNQRMNRIPKRIDPGDFIGEKFKAEKDRSDGNHRRFAQHHQFRIFHGNIHPAEIDRRSGNQNDKIKIETGEGRKAEGNSQCFEHFHGLSRVSYNAIGRGVRSFDTVSLTHEP